MLSDNIRFMQVELANVGMKTSYIYTKLEDLDGHLQNSNDDLLERLTTLLESFEKAQNKVKEKHILNSLAFADMDARFHTIHAAEPKTFDWIFNDPDILREKESSLVINFTDWLKSGSDIFHIVGKPGSGKSTLMKFLCEHEATEEHLQEWASADDKELIFCKFFFWRITTVAEQKTLKGLIRSLLYGVISQEPSLCRRLFPKQWGFNKGASHRGLRIELGDREISDAFEALMNDAQIFEEFRLCFFIDGLDEFEQNIMLQNDTHASLARKLQKWATQSRGYVKMCVSSRPLLEFTKIFPVAQQITLQKLTKSDIVTLVTNRLEKNEAFAELRECSEDENRRCDELVQNILGEAEGVFLWVVLVLNELEQALANSDSLEVLERIVATAHKEIRKFVKAILESIPERYRRGSYYLLAVVMRMSGFLATKAKAEAALQALIDGSKKLTRGAHCVNLEDCAVLFDAADKGNILDCDENLAVITRNLHEDKEARVKEKERLVARCRGLAEVDNHLDIRFTHRAIPEALQDLFSENELKESVQDESVAELLTWIMLAEIRRRWKYENLEGPWTGRWRGGDPDKKFLSSLQKVQYVTLNCLRMYPVALENSETMIKLLHSIQETILLVQYGAAKPADDVWDGWTWMQHGDVVTRRQLKLGVFEYWQLHVYTGWLIDTQLSPNKDKKRLLAILCEIVIVAAEDCHYFSPTSFDFVVDKLFERGLTLDANHSPEFVHGQCQKLECQVWHEFVCRELHYTMTHTTLRPLGEYAHRNEKMRFNWRGLETLLRFGADPDVYLSTDEEQLEGVLLGPTGDVLYKGSPDPKSSFSSRKLFLSPGPSKVSLMDFVKIHKPPNMDKLLRLIQQNMEKKMARATPVVPLIESGTNPNPDLRGAIEELSNSIELAAQEEPPNLVPRQTW
jgi:hypothetical protein